MGESLHCHLCGKPATVHLTQIADNKVHKIDLCEACAQSKGVTDPEGFSLADLLDQSPAPFEMGSPDPVTCPVCGLGPSDFKQRGRFGCPSCYETFADVLPPMLGSMHKGTSHCGKVPAQSVNRAALRHRLSELERNLQEAVRCERYEDAARYRDELKTVSLSLADSSRP